MVERFLRLMRDHIFVLSDVKKLIDEIFKPEELSDEKIIYLKENKNLIFEFYNTIKAMENWEENNILNLIKDVGKKLSIKGKNLYHPLRVLITHKDEGPEIYIYLYLLGKDETLKRIEEVISKL